MRMAEDRLDAVIGASIAALVGIVLICAAVIPTATTFIDGLTGANQTKYGPLLGVVLIMVIIGLIIGVLRFYSSARR